MVKDKATGRLLILSNNHVLANTSNGKDNRSKPGDPILQPGVLDNGKPERDIIGKMWRFVPIYSLADNSGCPIARIAKRGAARLLSFFLRDMDGLKFYREISRENVVDAAVARPLNEELIESYVLGLGEITGPGEVKVGQTVRKSGRTSGVTEGKVRAVDVTIRVNIGKGSQAIFTDQVLTDMLSKPGDSGSIVLDENNRAVGLLFAGSNNMTLFNRFSRVMDLLDVTL